MKTYRNLARDFCPDETLFSADILAYIKENKCADG